jgi:Xaa-Pro dipeptidase
LLLQPNSGEPLEAVAGADWVFEPGMTFHTYLLNRGFGMSETIVITETGYERLTNFPRQLFIAE